MESLKEEIVVVKRITTNAWVKNLNGINKDKVIGSYKGADGSQAKTRISLGIDKNTGKRKIVLTNTEQKEFEDKLGLAVDTLIPSSSFWAEFSVDLEGTDLILKPESNPMDALKLKVLQSKSIVAKDMNSITAYSEFVIMSETEEAKKSNVSRKAKKEAFVAFANMSTAEMEEVLIALGKKVTNSSAEVIEDMLGRELEISPIKFLSIIKNPKFKALVYLNKLVNIGVIQRRAGAYLYEGEVLGTDPESTVDFLNDKENAVVLGQVNSSYTSKTKIKKEQL